MFMMNSDSGLFRRSTELVTDGFVARGVCFSREPELYVPLYEAKMVHQFDHRYAEFDDLMARSARHQLPALNDTRHEDPHVVVTPHYWVARPEVESRPAEWKHDWLIGWRRCDRRASQCAYRDRLRCYRGTERGTAYRSRPQSNGSRLILCLLGN